MKNKSIIDKYKGKTFAEIAAKLDKKFPYRSVNNQEMEAYKAEIKQLQKHQDMKRLEVQASEYLKNGGKIPKYQLGTKSTDPLGGVYDIAKMIYDAQGAGKNLTPTLNYNGFNRTPTPNVLPTLNSSVTPKDSLADGIPSYTIPDSGETSTFKDAPKTPVDRNIFTPALIGKALETGINLSQLAGGYDKFEPIDNPNASKVERLMAERGIDKTAIRNELLSAFNAARSNNQRARSVNVANALDTNLLNQTQSALERASLDEQTTNLGLKADFASTLNNLGQQSVETQERARMLTSQSKGNFQTELSKFGMSLTNMGKFITDVRTNKQNQQTIANILNTKYKNVGIDTKVTDRMLSGKMTQNDIIKLNNAVGTQAAEALIEAFHFKNKENE